MGTAAIQGQLWGRAARDWAQIQEPLHRPLWEAMLEAALVGSGTRFLDAGCGGGGSCVLAAERGARVSGLDAAEGLLKIARKRVPRGQFQAGDIQTLPYEDNSFDAVFAANSVQFALDPVAALCEFGRVCTLGGRIVAGLFGSPDKVAFRAIVAAARDALPDLQPGAGPFNLSMPGHLQSLFEAAGLFVLQTNEVDCPFRYQDSQSFLQATASAGPMQETIRAIGVDNLRRALLEAVRPFRLGNGSICIQPNIFQYVVATL